MSDETIASTSTETAAPVEAVATESAPVIAPVETSPAAAPEDDRLRRGFAALSRKEKDIREREKGIKRFEDLSAKAKASPLEFLQEFGLSYDQLTDLILGGESEKPAPTADDRVAALEARLEAERTERETSAKAAQEATIERQINTFKEGVLKHGIKTAGDKFECINAKGDDGIELVWEVIESYHETHGEVLNWERAAIEVEQHLEAEARKVLGLKKFRQAGATSEEPRSANGGTLSRSGGGEMPVLGGDANLPLDSMERNRIIMSSTKLWG
ncbi:MAG: hypothetical protein M3R04_10455 [bacterium]|nr:hypothetical protein [bacterium]